MTLFPLRPLTVEETRLAQDRDMPAKPEPTTEWMVRVFGSIEAWHKSRTNLRFVCRGPKRKQVIHLRLLSSRETKWKLPCPDRPTPPEIAQAVRRMVTGIGPRTRLAYILDGQHRIAIGRRGEPADNLRRELVAAYGLVWNAEVRPENDALAEYVAAGGNYRPFARELRIKDEVFLAKAMNPVEVERSVLMSDRQLDRVWRLRAVHEGPEDALIGDPGEWAQDEVREEVVIGDPGGEAEPPAPLPMAIPKSDGRGKQSMYFGFALNYGGGHRWDLEDFEPPLRIALGGLLNRQLGFGNSAHADEVIAYRGEGFHWGRKHPLAPREVETWKRGPVCRTLEHPEPMATASRNILQSGSKAVARRSPI